MYGEIFLNIEPQSVNSAEIKNILLEGYKKLFSEVNLENNNTGKNAFTTAFLQIMNKQSALASVGINTESLTMIRTRFILEWHSSFSGQFPFKLFELQQQLLKEGMFDAYNHWLFTATQNLPLYQNWTITHAAEYNDLVRFQSGRIFKIPAGQYYR